MITDELTTYIQTRIWFSREQGKIDFDNVWLDLDPERLEEVRKWNDEVVQVVYETTGGFDVPPEYKIDANPFIGMFPDHITNGIVFFLVRGYQKDLPGGKLRQHVYYDLP
jgi:hypothetical protein